MKKFLSLVLACAMILSLCVCFVFPTAAEDATYNGWTVYASEEEYADDFEGMKKSIPGYKYTSEGFSTFGGEWKRSSPYQLVQTKNAVNLKNGVYMEVVIDEFDYTSPEKWFNFNIWSDPNLSVGSCDEKYGEGVQTLIRPTAVADSYGVNGTVAPIAWYTESFTAAGSSQISEENRITEYAGTTQVDIGNGEYEVIEHNKVVLTLSVTWNDWDGYTVAINGAMATDVVHRYMNEAFASGEAYIGFAMYSSAAGSKQACTVTKFGTDANAKAPAGDESADPIIYEYAVADSADPDTVPAGQPAILMTGNRANSHLMSMPVSMTGTKLSITEENYVRATASKGTSDFGCWYVDNDISYDVKDFPMLMCVTKNLCTCGMGTHEDCLALESMSAYVMADNVVAPETAHLYRELEICYNPYLVANADGGVDNYLLFTLNLDGAEAGRFNGVRLDANGIDLSTPGFNEYDMCWVGLFRNEEEATVYAEEYLRNLGWRGEGYDPFEPDVNYGKISENEEISVSIPQNGARYCFAFTPSVSGPYWFRSHGSGSASGSICNESMNEVYSSAAHNSYEGFSMVCYLTAGRTYYMCTEDSRASNYTVSLTRRPDKERHEGKISEDTDISVFIDTPGEYYDFIFVPDESREYTFSSYDSYDTYGIIYDESNDLIIGSDDSYGTNQFSITYTFEAGKTYYLRVKFLNENALGYLNFRLEKGGVEKQPDLFLSGDMENSNLASIVPPSDGSAEVFITENGTVKLVANNSSANFGEWFPKSEFNISDYPVIMCVTKNFCSCGMDECLALEVMGASVTIDGNQHIWHELDMSWDPITKDGDSYLYFYFDAEERDVSGIIESITMTAKGIQFTTEGFNEMEMCWIAGFNSVPDAERYVKYYLSGEEGEVSYEYLEGNFFELEGSGTFFDDDFIGDDTCGEETTYPEEEEVRIRIEIIELGDSVTVRKKDDGIDYCFEFTPTRNGRYVFYSTGRYDVLGEIYDADGNCVASDDDSNGTNFIIEHYFRKGQTYYLYARLLGVNEGTFEIHLAKEFNNVDSDDIYSETDNIDKEERPNKENDKYKDDEDDKYKDDEDEDDEEEQEELFTNFSFNGCSLSLGASSFVIAAVSLASAGFICTKKRKED